MEAGQGELEPRVCSASGGRYQILMNDHTQGKRPSAVGVLFINFSGNLGI